MLSKHKPYIDWFRDAAPYINAHRGKTVVIALSGDAVVNKPIERFIHDIALLHFLGVKVILVHGSRIQTQQQLKTLNLESNFHNNIRITTAETLNPVVQAAAQVSAQLTALFSTGLPNTSMSGACITVSSGNYISAMPLGVLDGIDMQHSGKVRDVQCHAINQLLEQNHLIILSNIAFSKTGEIFNLSMSEVATQTAIKLNVDKLIFMTDSDFHQSQNNFSSGSEVRNWIATQQLSAQETDIMQHAAKAADHKVNRVHLINQHTDGSLLLELFTRDGCGSLISNQDYQGLRHAKLDDVTGIFELIQPLVNEGKLVPRSKEQLKQDILQFSVIEIDGLITACAAYVAIEDEYAEFFCLAVHEDYQNNGFASRLLKHIEQQAQSQNISTLFSLSTQAEHWFLDKGFVSGDISILPKSKKNVIDTKRQSKILYKKLNNI